MAGILVLGGLLRLYGLGDKSLWLDELVLARSAFGNGTLGSSLGFGAVVHPPGYLILMRLLEQFVGRSDFLVRLPAALFSTAGIVAIWALGRSLVRPVVGLVAAFLLAIAPFHIYYGQELHTYALFATTSTLLLWSLFRAARISVAVERQVGRTAFGDWLRAWWPFLLVAVIAMYSHYYAVFTVALCIILFPIFLLMEGGQAVSDLWREPDHRRAIRRFAATLVLIGVLYLPQAIFGLSNSMAYASSRVESVASGGLAVRFEIGPQLLADTFVAFLIGRTFSLEMSRGLIVVMSIFLVAGFVWMLVQPAGPARRRYRLLALAAIIWMLAPLPLVAWLAQRAGESFAARRLIFAFPLLVLVEAIGIAGLAALVSKLIGGQTTAAGNKQSKSVMAIAVVAMLAVVSWLTVSSLTSYYIRPKQDYRTAARLLQARVGPNDVVATMGSMTGPNLSWYYPGATTTLSDTMVQSLSLFCSDDAAGQSGPVDAIYLVSTTPGANLSAKSTAWIEENFVEVPLYQISLFYRNCRHGEAKDVEAGQMFAEALAQPVVFQATRQAFESYSRSLTTTASSEQPSDVQATPKVVRPDLPALVALLQGEVNSDPGNAAAVLRLALGLSAAGQQEKAVEQISLARNLDPANPMVYYLSAKILSANGQNEEARDSLAGGLRATGDDPLLKQLQVEMNSGPTSLANDVQQAMAQIRSQLQSGDNAGAIRAAQVLATQAPNAFQVQLLLGDSYQQAGQSDAALDAYRRAASMAPDKSDAYLRASDILLGQGAAEEARIAALDAVTRDVNQWRSWLALGNAYAALLQENPDYADRAVDSLAVASALAPRMTKAPRQALAELYSVLDRPQDAVDTLQSLAADFPDDPVIQASLAGHLQAAGQLSDSIAGFRTRVDQEPDNRSARISLAAALTTDGQDQEALAEYEEIIQRWPDYTQAWVRKGELLESMGETKAALAAYEAAVAAGPDDPNLRFILAYAYRHLATPEQAIKAFETALSMDPNRPAARKALDELKSGQGQ